MSNPPLLELRGFSKSYGENRVLEGVSLAFQAGEIHALVGENGAGKSTLIRCCTGLVKSEQGTLLYQGRPVLLADPGRARELGIRAVHQEGELFPDLSLAENLMHAEGTSGNPWNIDWRSVAACARDDIAALEIDLPVTEVAASLSSGQRMLAEIATCLARECRLLFLDEPTATLSAGESDRLLSRLESLRASGLAVVYVSHRLEEVLRLADRITVLRDGRVVATGVRGDFDRARLVQAMIGRAWAPAASVVRPAPGPVVLAAAGLTDAAERFGAVDIELRAGEITCLYGLVGAGRSELAQALVGLRRSTGKVTLDGQIFAPSDPDDAVRAGVVLVPEDRRAAGIFARHSCRANVSVPWLDRLGRAGFISRQRERRQTVAVADRLATRYGDIEQPIGTLSGGNQQKLLFGRWLERDPRVLIVDEPTRGVDVGAKAEIHGALRDLAGRGKAVLAITSDLPEAQQLGHRILVMREGRLGGDFAAGAAESTLLQAALPVPGGRTPRRELTRLVRWLQTARHLGVFIALMILIGLSAWVGGRDFASVDNAVSVAAAAALVSIAAAGMAQVLIVGGIDVSVGSMLGVTAALAGTAALRGMPPFAAAGVGVVVGAALGMASAFIANWGRVHTIVVTLAGIYVLRGVMLRFTGGYEVTGFPEGFRALATGNWAGLPMIVGIAGCVHLANAWFLGRTLAGRRLYAVGGSEKAARMVGISPERLRLQAFAVCGALVGLAGALWGAYYGKVQSGTGVGFELQVIAAAVIGGCAVTGGRGHAAGVVAGALLIAVIYNVLVLLRVSSHWQGVFVGALILGAAAIDRLIQSRWRESR